MALSYAKEIVSISSDVSTQCTNVTDRQTDHRTVTLIAIGEIACQNCRLKILTVVCTVDTVQSTE